MSSTTIYRPLTLPGFEHPLLKLDMRLGHIQQILTGQPRPKTTTLRTQPHNGLYVLVQSLQAQRLAAPGLAAPGLAAPVAVVELVHLGERNRRAMSDAQFAKLIASEGAADEAALLETLKAIYPWHWNAFWHGGGTLHLHRIKLLRRVPSPESRVPSQDGAA